MLLVLRAEEMVAWAKGRSLVYFLGWPTECVRLVTMRGKGLKNCVGLKSMGGYAQTCGRENQEWWWRRSRPIYR